MDLIDDNGRLFGLINIIDALVVLLVLAVAVAGIALVTGQEPDPEPEIASTHATLDLGSQPQYVVSEINEGDTYRPGGDSQITITDVYVTPDDNQDRVTARVELEGPANGDTVEYDGAPPRLGRTLAITTDLYEISGDIRAVGSADTLERETTTVLLEDRVSRSTAEAVASGDEIRVAGRTVATVEDVRVYPTENPTQNDLVLNVSVDGYNQDGDLRFGDTPLREGQTLTLPSEDYILEGEIRRVDHPLQTDTTPLLVGATLDTDTAQDVTTGDLVQAGGDTVATVESVTRYGTNDPDQKRVIVGLDAHTHSFGGQTFFGQTHVTEGGHLPIQTDHYDFAVEIDRVGATEPLGTPTTKTVTLRKTDVSEPMAAAITTGMSERSGNKTVATVTNVDVQPSVVLIHGDEGDLGVYDHPIDRDVTLTTELRVRESVSGTQFKGQTIQQGSTVTLDLGSVTVRATVVDIS